MDYINIFSVYDNGKKGHKFMLPKHFYEYPNDKIDYYKNGIDYFNLFYGNMKGKHLNLLQKMEMIKEHFEHSENQKMFLTVLKCEIIPKLKDEGFLDLSKVIGEYIEELAPSVSQTKTTPSISPPLARHWALFFAYLNPSVFDVKPSIEQFCKEHKANVTAEKVRQQFYRRDYNNYKSRAIIQNLSDIEFVLTHFLQAYPQQAATAKQEIEQIKNLL
jgi:hypothetical protein